MIAMLTGLVSCQQEVFPEQENIPEGYMKISFSAAVPGMQEVMTKSVDIDGGGIQDMTLFCFDEFGFFISSEKAELNPKTDLNGNISTTFDALVPSNTNRIHFLSNQNMIGFKETDFRNESESRVLALLEGSSGRMIYWARYQYDPNGTVQGFAAQLKAQQIPVSADKNSATANIVMLRNHAYVTIENTETNQQYFNTTGFVVYNTMAYGTVAPYDKENNRFPTIGEWLADDYVCLPEPERRVKMSNITGVNKATVIDNSEIFGQFIFECENKLNDPVSVILRGQSPTAWDETGKVTKWGEDKFYRVLLQDDEGNTIPVRRNHHYILNVTGELMNGKDTFNEALDAPATNNIWVSIDPTIREVAGPIRVGENSYVDYILKVHKTAYVETGNPNASTSAKQLTVYYNLERKDGADLTATEKPVISWIDDSQDVASSREDNFNDASPVTVEGETYNGNSVLTLNAMNGLPIRRGTLLVKFGMLQRTIEVVTVTEQSFMPSWVSTQVYGQVSATDKSSRAHVTVMFTVPKDTPKELFPMKVLISVNNLDLRSSAGIALPVVKEGDADYFGDRIGRYDPDGEINESNPAIGYKYVYEIASQEDAGTQRVYFENILNESATDVDFVTIEALHFQKVSKTVTFSGESTLSIASDDKMDLETPDPTNNIFTYNGDGSAGRPADENIRYILVPQKINAPVNFDLVLKTGRGDDATPVAPNQKKDASGNTIADEFFFYSQNLTPNGTQNPADCSFQSNVWDMGESGSARLFSIVKTMTTDAPSNFNVQFKTNKAKSAEVVRISSNQPQSVSGLASGNYAGQTYRSFVFELANYRPFTFASQFGDDVMTAGETQMTSELAYSNVGTPVTLQFDVKSFLSTSDESVGGSAPAGISVDPFGTEFEIYIDAPMLEIDLPVDGQGRYVYTVPATATDTRVSLDFDTKSIVTEGDIVISSNQEKVVFDTETITIMNAPLQGRITYGVSPVAVPADKFVAFERTRDNTRIGSMTIHAPESGSNNNYSLRLRKEYEFNWTDSITIYYTDDSGVKYSHTCALYDLFRNSSINLLPPAPQQ